MAVHVGEDDTKIAAAAAVEAIVVPAATSSALGPLAPLVEAAREYAARAKAGNTRRAYACDWASFEAWCQGGQLQALPASLGTVALYLTSMAKEGRSGRSLRASSITRALSGIAYTHREAGYELDVQHKQLRSVLEGIRRDLKVAPRKKAPITDVELAAMVATLGSTILATRDRAMILLGWHGALRRSELVALDVDDLKLVDEGMVVRIGSSKTDQEGKGAYVGVPRAADVRLCAVRAVRTWLAVAGHDDGALFRAVGVGCVGDRLESSAVATAVKHAARAAGLDVAKFSAHSLRSGFATTAAENGKGLPEIMKHGRWKNAEVCMGYIRSVSLFKNNAAMGLV